MTPDCIVSPDWSLPENVGVAITTRAAGNLAVHVGDDPARVLLRRRQLQRYLQLPVAVNYLTQQHTNLVSRHPFIKRPSDGLWAGSIASCAILTADCLPLLLCSANGQQIAAVHAGWRGLATGILLSAIDQFSEPASQLRLFIGPAICQSCFEVGADVVRAFEDSIPNSADYFSQHKSRLGDQLKWQCDLPGLAEHQARLCGITNVQQSDLCTACRDDLFFSHRKNKDAGRFASIIWRKHDRPT